MAVTASGGPDRVRRVDIDDVPRTHLPGCGMVRVRINGLCLADTGLNPAQAFAAATGVAADPLGRSDIGRLPSGMSADVVYAGPWSDFSALDTRIRSVLQSAAL